MKVRLLRDARVLHHAGEIVEVSPVVADFLVSTLSAEPVVPAVTPKPAADKPVEKSTAKKGRR